MSTNNNVDLQKSPSKMRDETLKSSLKQQGDEYIPPPKKVDEYIPTTRGAGEDPILPQYSIYIYRRRNPT